MGVQEEKVGIKTLKDLWELLLPASSFARNSLEYAEEWFIEILEFIDTVVEKGVKGDQSVFEYIRTCGEAVRLDAYRFLKNLVYIRKTVDDDFADLAKTLAKVLGIEEKEKKESSA
jgi:hypothetical protein